ncbi:MAG: SusD/RagB family nutrient-binding outer membrane lipoprotein, partial [Chitinophagaceae bacterium]
RKIINTAKASLILLMLGVVSCNKLTNLNINPNGTTPESANPSFLMTGVLTNTANDYLLLSYWDPFGSVMQYVQKDAFQGDGNYNWSDQSWDQYYALLINNKEAYDLAQKENRPFVMGVSLVMKSFIFGLITDLWGAAPYTAALNGAQGGNTNLLPAYDNQGTIYNGILSDLAKADSILSKITTTEAGGADVYYNGNASAWDKFANSLRLRYYMRLSIKEPDFAKAGIEEVVSEGNYFKTDADDATMSYLGTNENNSWPENLQFDNTQGSNFHRIKMCSTLVDTLEAYGDPRLAIWAAKVQIPIQITSSMSSSPDTIINGVRYIHPSAIPAGTLVDTGQNYVGLPPSISADPT